MLYFFFILFLRSCSDCDKCTDLDLCTYEDALYRAGYYCNGWPLFNRVAPPETQFYSPVETKTISCSSFNQTGCILWEEVKISSEELASTTCTCSSYLTADNQDYCEAWDCTGVGVSKCNKGESNCGGFSAYGSISWDTSCCYESCRETEDSNGRKTRICTPETMNTKSVFVLTHRWANCQPMVPHTTVMVGSVLTMG